MNNFSCATTAAAATASSINNGYTNGYATTNGGTVNGDKPASQQPQAASNGNSSLKNGQNKSSSTGVSAPAAPVVSTKSHQRLMLGQKAGEELQQVGWLAGGGDLFQVFPGNNCIRKFVGDVNKTELAFATTTPNSSTILLIWAKLLLAEMIFPLCRTVFQSSGQWTAECQPLDQPLSLVSSVGETAGLGQTSPVSQEKSVAQVDNGGIVMQSDALSADQLADLQRRIEETLRSQALTHLYFLIIQTNRRVITDLSH
uniref:Uncharacterized protein n=1 Tax=Ditylenchus dipsaci TaxID=166011 RepID=A0A915DFC2_9BILA